MESSRQSVMMHCCQKIACKSCVDEWFSKNQTCPYCRENFKDPTIPKYTDVSWLDCVSEIINVYSLTADQETICPLHSKQYEYICQDCNQYICAGCLFDMITGASNKHKNHKLISIQEEFSKIKQKIIQKMPAIVQYLDKLKEYALDLRQNSRDLNGDKDEINGDMAEKFNVIIKLVKNEFQQRDEILTRLKALGANAINDLNEEIKAAKAQLSNGTAASITEALNNLKAVERKNEKFKNIASTTLLKNPLLPDYHTFEIRIPNFIEIKNKYELLPQDEVRYIYSKKIPCYGNKWRAKIYPNGNGNGLGTHLSFFVELLSGPVELTPYQYRVEVIPTNPGAAQIWKQYSSDYISTDSWGWNKAASLSTITTPDYIDKNETLTLQLSIRACARYQECADMKALIDRKRQKIKALKELLKRNEVSTDKVETEEDEEDGE
ncbi:B-box zinc finger family protein [Trichomonas vaginalis G3]|uniref:B-box zinc finger family protein n=1 Tax=Trichomonas vaginalis (strain ATCC PRA-98 / G3) TaxID=412133 RepID=A2FU86_TRIV3|nr:zinc ion binding [Trichomonas vaginalis G3]EAX91517.1 B-box zinc finger family protein [Trichomonas vaginalis G3]KAI5537955.1 zinc ion binding [Trichomonas vaginalis G3]|eukprot:XP_001304447.1 B-box zinc finger family protein [Trichomonas vaginalis G3]